MIAAAAALAVAAASCTSTPAPQHHSPGRTSPPSDQEQPGQVGDKFEVSSNGQKYEVTLLGFDQMARPETDFDAAPAGHHLAAAEFRVTAVDKTDENSNLSATVTGSNQQAYKSALSAVAAGTNFSSGQIRLQPGSSLVGWVSFEVPDGVHAAKVQWTPSAGFGDHGAEWMVSPISTVSPGATSPAATSPAATTPPAATPPPGGGAPGVTTPSDVVQAYFDAINQKNYQKAWDLGGKNLESSYSAFMSGFATTSMVSVQVLDVSGDPGHGVVTVRLSTLETTGETKVFMGDYTVSGGEITQASVHEAS